MVAFSAIGRVNPGAGISSVWYASAAVTAQCFVIQRHLLHALHPYKGTGPTVFSVYIRERVKVEIDFDCEEEIYVPMKRPDGHVTPPRRGAQ